MAAREQGRSTTTKTAVSSRPAPKTTSAKSTVTKIKQPISTKSESKTNPARSVPSKASSATAAKPTAKSSPKLVTRAKAEASRTTKTAVKISSKPNLNPPKPVKIHPTRAAQFAQTPTLLGLEPDHVARLLHDRPIWVDELSGIGLLVAGLVLLIAQLNGSVSDALANSVAFTVRTLVGQGGSLVLSIMIMVAGVAIILSRLGIIIRLTIRRAILIETAFIAFVALLHLLSRDPEARALAREGGGGGYIGWAVSALIALPFGTALSTVIYTLIFGTAVAALVGVQRRHVRAVMLWLFRQLSLAIGWLSRLSARLPQPIDPPMAQPIMVTTANQPPADYNYPLQNAGSPAAYVESPVPQNAPVGQPAPRIQPTSIPSSVRSPSVPQPISSPLIPKPIPKPEVPKPRVPSVTIVTPDVSAMPAPIPRELIPDADNPSKLILRGLEVEPQYQAGKRFKVNNFKEARQSLKRGSALPSLTLLHEVELNHPTDEEVNTNAEIIENTLAEFDIDVAVIDVKVGPTVTQYAVQPFRETTNAQGQTTTQRVRVNKIASLSSDLALALSAKRLRIQPYVPGHNYMGIEVPNRTPSLVALRPTLESKAFAQAYAKPDPERPTQTIEQPLVFPLGRDVSGAPVIVNLATLPHLLIAGTTGSGKSVCLTALTLALTLMNGPDRLRLVMLDPKMVELTRFNGLPHLMGPVETDKERILGVLRWATREMDRRYKLLEVEAARNIETYNRALGKRRKAEHLPYIVIVVDEIGDLMLSFPDETERTITRLAQMARAVGMHLIVTTQRPSVDIITGLIKANFPARISFAVTSGIDSRVILDTVGAESLIGRGDMLYLPPDAAEPRRVQGCYASDEELEKVMTFWKEQTDPAAMPISAPWERGVTRRDALIQAEPLLENAIALVVREGSASPFMIQRQLGIDYPRAVRLMDMLQQLGVTGITRSDGRTRDVIVKPDSEQYRMLLARKQ